MREGRREGMYEGGKEREYVQGREERVCKEGGKEKAYV